jgi:hypothetical protein
MWKCRACGGENSPESSSCGCGQARLPKEVLLRCTRTGQQLAIHTTLPVGKPLLLKLDPEEGKFASTEQFRVELDAKRGCLVRSSPGAVNASFLNGSAIPEEGALLKSGDVLSLAGKRLMLEVELRYGD